jgi:hypothetical protein
MRWRTRTENLHVLHPVVKLADGTLLVGSQTFSSPQRPMMGSNAFSANFVVSEVTFDDQRWFQLDPTRVVTVKEVGNPDLSRVDEIGFVDLMPGGGHGRRGLRQRAGRHLLVIRQERSLDDDLAQRAELAARRRDGRQRGAIGSSAPSGARRDRITTIPSTVPGGRS